MTQDWGSLRLSTQASGAQSPLLPVDLACAVKSRAGRGVELLTALPHAAGLGDFLQNMPCPLQSVCVWGGVVWGEGFQLPALLPPVLP